MSAKLLARPLPEFFFEEKPFIPSPNWIYPSRATLRRGEGNAEDTTREREADRNSGLQALTRGPQRGTERGPDGRIPTILAPALICRAQHKCWPAHTLRIAGLERPRPSPVLQMTVATAELGQGTGPANEGGRSSDQPFILSYQL